MQYIDLKSWETFCINLCRINSNYIIMDILSVSELCNNKTINDYLKNFSNKTIIFLNGDIDFPPIKANSFFCEHLDLSYEERINYDIIPCIEKYNIKIVCWHSSIIHPNVLMIPLGITWQVNVNINYIEQSINAVNKNILCYANYGLPGPDCWHGRIRQNLFKTIKQIKWITIDNIVLDTQYRKTQERYNNYFDNLLKSKFAICPRGCGIDCYRMYDALICKCIPIILKSNDFYKNLSNLPILALDKWEDLNDYDENKLNKLYDKILKEKQNYMEYLSFNLYTDAVINLYK